MKVSELFGVEQVHVTIEFPDGRIYTGLFQAVEMMMTVDVGEPPRSAMDDYASCYIASTSNPIVDLRLISTGTVLTSMADISRAKSASEWLCEYCKGANLRKDLNCCHCAAPRPFIYREEAHEF